MIKIRAIKLQQVWKHLWQRTIKIIQGIDKVKRGRRTQRTDKFQKSIILIQKRMCLVRKPLRVKKVEVRFYWIEKRFLKFKKLLNFLIPRMMRLMNSLRMTSMRIKSWRISKVHLNRKSSRSRKKRKRTKIRK